MKANSKIKLIALSISLLASSGAMAALGSLRVNSGLGEPFSGTVTVTGSEAKELLKGSKPSFSDGRLKANVRKSGNDAVVSLSSSSAINDPVIVFQMRVRNQSRQYTALIDPSSAKAKAALAQAKKDAAASDKDKNDKAEKESKKKAEQIKAEKEKAAAAEKQKQEEAKQKQEEAQRKREEAKQKREEAKQKAEAAAKERQQTGSRMHTVQPDETLFIIADKLRPDNMTPDQAIRALVKANPKKLGGRPDRLLAGETLMLPAGFKSSAEPAAADETAAEAGSKGKEGSGKAGMPESTPPAPPPEAAAPKEAVVRENTAAPEETPAGQGPSENDAAAAPPSPEPQGAEGEADQPPQEAEPVSPPPAAKPAQSVTEAAEDEEGGSSLWKMVLLGGLGLTIILLLAKLIIDRKSAIKPAQEGDAEGEDDDISIEQQDGIRLHQPVAKPEKPKAPITKNQQAEGLETDDFDLEDDDIFFEPVESANDGKTGENGSFDLDLGVLDLDSQQIGIVSSAVTNDEETRRLENADWDKIESFESVFEPDEFAAPQAAAPAAGSAQTGKRAEESEVVSWAGTVKPLFGGESKPAAAAAKPAVAKEAEKVQAAAPATEPAADTGFAAFAEADALLDFEHPAAPEIAAEPAVAFEPPTAEPAVAFEPPAAEPAVAFEPPTVEPAVAFEPPAAEPAVAFESPAVEPALDFEPALEFVTDTAVEPALAAEPVMAEESFAIGAEPFDLPDTGIGMPSPKEADLSEPAAEPQIELEPLAFEPQVEAEPLAFAPEPAAASADIAGAELEIPQPVPSAEDKVSVAAETAIEPLNLQPEPADFVAEAPVMEAEPLANPFEPVQVAPVETVIAESTVLPEAELAVDVFEPVQAEPATAVFAEEAVAADPLPESFEAVQIEPVSLLAEETGVVEAEPLSNPFAGEDQLPQQNAAQPLSFEEPIVVEAAPPQLDPFAQQQDGLQAAFVDEPADWQDDVDTGSTVTFDDSQLDAAGDLEIDWSSLDAAGGSTESKPAFVSESVGMTAPLEAKYELAEMYIEIGDPDAARETLYELIEESGGTIQAKSKALLASIGG